MSSQASHVPSPAPPPEKAGLDARRAAQAFGIAALIATPLLFSCNAIIGRASVDHVGPWTLACLRWSVAVLILAPFVARDVVARRHALLRQWRSLAVLGFIGMWMSGGVFYTALHYTTATNGTLIYTVTPLVIVILERIFRGRPIAWREVLGILIASLGITSIVSRGSLATLMSLDLNIGDFLVLGCTVAWAIYTVILRRPALAALPVPSVFFCLAAAGTLMLWPAMVAEVAVTGAFPSAARDWLAILTAAVVGSVLAFLGYQYVVKALGPSVAGLSMYLTPVSGVALAMFVLGERPDHAVIAGSVLVILGVVLATLPVTLLSRRAARR